MKIAFLGLGKLGLPVALAIESRGHDVRGVDSSYLVASTLRNRQTGQIEEGITELLAGTAIRLVDLVSAAEWADVLFVAVQTPHHEEYEGATPLPETRADFDYSYLRAAVGAAVAAADGRTGDPLVLAVISTVLPGTVDRDIRPLLSSNVRLVYNPSFIAMGTAIRDYIHPEFVLLGVDDPTAADLLERFYETITDAPVRRMSVPSAELTKVAYNTFLTAKVTIVNLLAQVADATGADVDDVTGALTAATNRILAPTYMTAGMGDGGGCHPRDNIAMSWLAGQHGLPDLFGALMEARQEHALWLAEIVRKAAGWDLPIVVLGRAYKKGSSLTAGSAARLVAGFLHDPIVWDPHVDGNHFPYRPKTPAVYLIATDHPEFECFPFRPGDVVVDPWGIIPAQRGVAIERPGRT